MKKAVYGSIIIENVDKIHRNSVIISEDDIVTKIIPETSFNPDMVDDYVKVSNGIISPGFINCHTHLELSALPKIHVNSFTDWILDLVKKRSKIPIEEQYERAIETIEKTIQQGTIAFGDITNSGMLIDYLNTKNIPNYSFIEVLGFQQNKCEKIISDLTEKFADTLKKYPNVSLSPHAPYSMSADLMKKIKSDRLQSIHIDESPEERTFLNSGKGEIYDFLNGIGVWDKEWNVPNQTPYEYIKKFGYLKNTLLVHALNITETDIPLIKDSTVVLCPRSNEFLHGKSPDIQMLLDNNIHCVLGTDSLSSCDDLSILNEMKHIYQTQKIDPKLLFKMATENGAKALGLTSIGTLSVGKRFLYHVARMKDLPNSPFKELLI